MRKNSRKIVALILTAMMMTTTLAGCSLKEMVPGSSEIETTTATETDTSATDAPETETEAPEAAGLKLKKASPAATDGDKILFVGNSHTYVNDLPGIFYELVYAAGYEVNVYDLSDGSYYLEMFADPEDENGAILTEALETEEWDFVVLQENTNAAINAEEEMLPQATKLDKMIKNAGGQTALLMTWAPEKGASAFSREIVQDLLSEGYQLVANELDALLIPGGIAFSDALSENSDLKLWGEDGQHASYEGTYLAACTAYAVIFQESPQGNTFIGELDEEVAQELQAVAHKLVLAE